MSDTLRKTIALLAIVVFSLLLWRLHRLSSEGEARSRRKNITIICKAGIFGALSALLYVVPIFTIKIPFFPEFLTLHFDEVPVLIAGLSEGPLCALFVLVCKTIIKLPFSTTATVGEWADLLLSSLFILPICMIYGKKKGWKRLVVGFLVGTPLQLGFAMLLNVYALVPFYSSLYGIPMDSLLALCQKANPAISDLSWGYALFAVLPFNAMKDAVVIALSFLLYRALKTLLEKDRE